MLTTPYSDHPGGTALTGGAAAVPGSTAATGAGRPLTGGPAAGERSPAGEVRPGQATAQALPLSVNAVGAVFGPSTAARKPRVTEPPAGMVLV